MIPIELRLALNDCDKKSTANDAAWAKIERFRDDFTSPDHAIASLPEKLNATLQHSIPTASTLHLGTNPRKSFLMDDE